MAAVDGHNRAEGGEDKIEPPTDTEYDAMLQRLGDNDSVN